MYLARIVSINNIPSSGLATLGASSPTTSAGARGVCGRLLDLISVPSLGLLCALALLAFDLLSVLDACESRCRFLLRWRCSCHSISSELVVEPDTLSDISADTMQKKTENKQWIRISRYGCQWYKYALSSSGSLSNVASDIQKIHGNWTEACCLTPKGQRVLLYSIHNNLYKPPTSIEFKVYMTLKPYLTKPTTKRK